MNRIIIIGNGFEKAHGLPTAYTDFMDGYWKDFAQKISIFEPYEDDFIRFEKIGGPKSEYDAWNATEFGVNNEGR